MVAPPGDEFWPYTEDEAAAIRGELRTNPGAALNRIVNAARIFAALHQEHRTKPNPAKEIRELEIALTGLIRAISGLSDEAEAHLRRHCQTIEDAPMDRIELMGAVHGFWRENKSGFSQQPAKMGPGRIADRLTQSLVGQFEKIFIEGHGGTRPRTGWPAFIALCWEPLARNKLLAPLNVKARQKSLTKARRRNPPRGKLINAGDTR
jgi:hypothetical protein